MNIVKIEGSAVTVELSIPDCLLLAAATLYANSRDGGDLPYEQAEALAAGLLAQAFAAYLIEDIGTPRTLHGMWDTWSPLIHKDTEPRRMPMPAALARTLDREA